MKFIKNFFSLNNKELKDISNIKKEHLYQKRFIQIILMKYIKNI